MKKIFYFLTLFFVINLFLISNYDLYWDEAVYIGIGKSLYSDSMIGLMEEFRPILLPFLVGFIWKIGLNSIIIWKIMSLVMSILCLYFTFLIGKEKSEKVGFLSSVILGLTPVYFLFSTHILTEIPSVLFSLISIYLLLKKRYLFSGILAGLSFLMKFPSGLILIIIGMILIRYKLIKKYLNVLAGFTLVILPYLFYNYISYGDFLGSIVSASIHQSNINYSIIDNTLSSHIYNIFYYLLNIIIQNPIYVFGIAAFFSAKKNESMKIPLIVLIIYFTLIINKQIRFSILFLPYLAILAGEKIVKMKKYFPILVILLILPFTLIYKDAGYKANEVEINKIYKTWDFPNQLQSTSPFPAAYHDIKMIPLYYDADYAYKNYDRDIPIFYNNEFYPCLDKECETKKAGLLELVKNRTLIKEAFIEEKYYLFE